MTGPGCSAVIDLFNVFSFFEIGATTTGIILPIRSTVVHCCSKSVIAPDVATVVMLVRASRYEYVGAQVGVGTGREA